MKINILMKKKKLWKKNQVKKIVRALKKKKSQMKVK